MGACQEEQNLFRFSSLWKGQDLEAIHITCSFPLEVNSDDLSYFHLKLCTFAGIVKKNFRQQAYQVSCIECKTHTFEVQLMLSRMQLPNWMYHTL